MSNKILLATHQFLPKWYTGTEQLVAKTAKNFNDLFFDFEIMSAEPLTKWWFLPRIYSRKFKDY